jgi:hypothetical protein
LLRSGSPQSVFQEQGKEQEMPKPEITREQIEAAKHTMIRRHKELSIYARLVLAELIAYDFIVSDQ